MTLVRRLVLAVTLAAWPLVHADAQERRRGPPQSEQRGPTDQRAPNEQRSGPGVLSLLPADSVTDHTVDSGGRSIAYTATAGTFSLYDGNGERSAAIFYTAYVVKDGGAQRPLTFVFNGGPGAASAYLHLGVAGPQAIAFGAKPDGVTPPLSDNPDTWLKFTDLVFVDPVGTGWSRPAKPDGGKDFWGVNSDASSLAKVIALYAAKNARGSAPLYLLGESYGGYRALKVARAVQREQGLVAAGIVMVSPFLDGSLSAGGRQNALSAALHLPSLAAAELDRRNAFTPEKLAEAERFALTDYLVALAGAPPQGEAARAFHARVAALTGVPVEIVARQRGFIGNAYVKQSVEGRAEVASHYDAAFTAPDPFPDSIVAEGPDPALDGFLQALGGAFVGYARERLGFKTDMTFHLLNREISGKWDWDGGRGRVNGARDMRELLGLNRALRMLIVHGRSDVVTPYGVSRYVLDHLPQIGDPGRVALKTYKGGHMFYFTPDERRAFTDDAAGFYKGRVGE